MRRRTGQSCAQISIKISVIILDKTDSTEQSACGFYSLCYLFSEIYGFIYILVFGHNDTNSSAGLSTS